MKALKIHSTDTDGNARHTVHTVDSYEYLNYHVDTATRTVTVYEHGEKILVVMGVNTVHVDKEYYPPEPVTPGENKQA